MNNKCEPLKKKDEECDEKDKEPCDFGMDCGKDDQNGKSKCIVEGTLETGHYASVNVFCSSFYSYNNYCVEAEGLREGYECETVSDCPIVLKNNNLTIPYFSKCLCSLNGKQYCLQISFFEKYKEQLHKQMEKYTPGSFPVAAMSSNEWNAELKAISSELINKLTEVPDCVRERYLHSEYLSAYITVLLAILII